MARDDEPLLTPAQVAALFGVDPKTVTRWVKSGKLTSIRSLGGHRRFRETEVRALLRGKSEAERMSSVSSDFTVVGESSDVGQESSQPTSVTHEHRSAEGSFPTEIVSAAEGSGSGIKSEDERPQESPGPTLPSDGERARTAAGQYEVVNYSHFGDALLVVLDAPSVVSGGDLEPAPLEASIEVSAYLSTEDQVLADSVFRALDVLAGLLGYEDPHDELLESGSIFRSAKANLRRGIDSEEGLRYRAKLSQAIDLIAIGERQAKVNTAEAEAFARTMASLGDITSACVRIGSMLIVKYPDSRGSDMVLVRQLSALELRTLERFPGIQRDPCNAIEMLAAAVMAAESVEDNSA